MKPTSGFKQFLQYINTYRIADTITRKDIFEEFPEYRNVSTIDNYRNYLTQAGYLKYRYTNGYVHRGRYILIEKPNINMTVSKLMSKAYPHNK